MKLAVNLTVEVIWLAVRKADLVKQFYLVITWNEDDNHRDDSSPSNEIKALLLSSY